MKTNFLIIIAQLLLLPREIISYAVQISIWYGYKIFLVVETQTPPSP